jgi:hypothetical protein
MGHIADICQPTSHDDSRSYGEGDSEVKVIRLATGALRRPPHGNEARGSAIPQEAARRFATPSRATARAGSSRDGRESSAGSSLDRPSPTGNLGTSMRTSKTSAKRRTRRSPMLAHETSPVSGASVVGMT